MKVQNIPTYIQIVGIAIIVGAVIFWAVTGRQSALIIGSGLSMMGLGQFRKIQIVLTEAKDKAKNGNAE